MAGCSKVESVSVRERSTSQIGFSTYTGRTVSKGGEGTLLQQSFNVGGFLSGNPSTRYFHATTYRYANNRFTGDTTRYWPESGESLDFYATSPLQYRNTSGNLVDFKPVDSTFTVAGIDGTTDILAARLVNRSYIDPVALNFGHKLTKIAFRATGYDPTKIYKIYSITVDAKSSAAYSFGTDSWNSPSDSCTYTFFDESRTIPAGTMTSVAVGDTLYLIPVQGATVTAKVCYAIYDGAVQIDTTTTPVEIELPVSGVWGVNKSVMYKLTLHFSSDATPIVFTADPSDWDADNTAEPIFHYVENGIDFGEGIRVGDVIWAPVNCGTDTSSANLHPNGLLYQFARAHGQGHDGEVGAPTGANIVNGATLSPEPEKFYYDLVSSDGSYYNRSYYYDWYAGERFREWPVYTDGGIGNPCPEGWRLPVDDEMGDLMYSDWDFQEHEGITLRDGWVRDTTLNVWKFNDELVFSCPGVRAFAESPDSLYVCEQTGIGAYWTSSVRPLLQSTRMISVDFDELCFALFYEDNARCGYFSTTRVFGLSVRCVKK